MDDNKQTEFRELRAKAREALDKDNRQQALIYHEKHRACQFRSELRTRPKIREGEPEISTLDHSKTQSQRSNMTGNDAGMYVDGTSSIYFP